MNAFDLFAMARKKDLQRISRHTKGEYSHGDVVNEAWLMAQTLATRTRAPVDLLDKTFQELLLSHLFQHLVRYTDLKVRRAERFDQPLGTGAEGRSARTLLDLLPGDEQDDPLARLLSLERPAPWLQRNARYSVASAYLVMLGHFNNSMHRVARHLLVSLSHAYRCCAKARALTASQHALTLAPPASIGVLRPWRHQRAVRIPNQMEFDFEQQLPFPAAE